MRRFLALVFMGLGVAALTAEEGGGKVEVKGPHICCKQCVNVATAILGKVPGVSDASADQKTKIVAFTAKDDKAAKAGFKALVDGGFFGTATAGGKQIKLDLPVLKKGETADVVSVKDVHVCCGACKNAINKLFKDAKVEYEGPGVQKTVRIEGKGLDRAGVVETLQKMGFYGTIVK